MCVAHSKYYILTVNDTSAMILWFFSKTPSTCGVGLTQLISGTGDGLLTIIKYDVMTENLT